MNDSGTAPKKLLVVEDDPGLQAQLKWAYPDFDVVIAGDRASAMAALRSEEPAVVTLDLGLPPDPDGTTEGFAVLDEIMALKPDTNVITFPRLVEPAKPEPTLFKELKKSKKAKPKGKRTAFKENTGSLPKSWFPAKVKGATGWFDPVANGQGWVIRFRDTKPLTEDSNEKSFQFPRISAETYLTLKGMKTDAERKQYLRDYVRGNLINAVKRGNDRARAVAARLALKS